jgi:beta-galactosidase
MAECHCPACQDGFRDFLRAEYGSVAALNDAWGTAFWAQTYRDFSEITSPVEQRPTWQNPHARLDWQRFCSRATTTFQREQVAILRSARPDWLLIHNGLFRNIAYREDGFASDLDSLGVDVYPCFLPPADRLHWQIALCDRARAIDGNFIVPEQQMGPGGQNGYVLDTPESGESPQMTWLSIARGADSLLYFRWRSCRYGSEMYWFGILDHDDVPRRRYREAAEVGAALRRIGPAVIGTTVRVQAGIAAVDFVGLSAHRALPMGLPEPDDLASGCLRALTSAGYAAGLVSPDDDPAGLDLLIVPSIAAADPAWVSRWEAWVRAGGTLVLTARTGHHDRRNRCLDRPLPGAFRDLAGVTVAEVGKRNHPAQRPLALRWGGIEAEAGPWYELLEPDAGTAVLATWSGRHLDGQPAGTCRRLGAGRVVYLGAMPTAATIAALTPVLATLAGLRRLLPETPPTVLVSVREAADRALWFVFNTGDAPVTVTLPAGRELLADRPVDGPLELPRFGTAIVLINRAG